MNEILKKERAASERMAAERVKDIQAAGPDPRFLGPDVEGAAVMWRTYQELTAKVLEQADYANIQGKLYKKKSAWRKYMRFYGLAEDEDKTLIETERDGQGYPVFSTAYVVIRNLAGQAWTGYHECHRIEKCCPAATGGACYRAGATVDPAYKHTCCIEGCNGRIHWTHPGDIPATAHTRAKNRAISDAIGAGEVSAEEVEGKAQGQGPAGDNGADPGPGADPLPACPNCGKPGRKSKFRGEFFCWKKQGGCGHEWEDETAGAEGADDRRRREDPPEGLPQRPGSEAFMPITEAQVRDFEAAAQLNGKGIVDVRAVWSILRLEDSSGIPARFYKDFMAWATGEINAKELAVLVCGDQALNSGKGRKRK